MQHQSLAQIRELIRPISGPDGRGSSDADVLIVGAGPIGLTAANILGTLGVSTILLERNDLTSDLPRALVIDDEYLRLLDTLGLRDVMADHLSPPFGIFFYSARGNPLVRVMPFMTPNGFGNRAGLMQPVFEKKLLEGAQRFACVDLQYRSTVTALAQDDAGVRLTVQTAAGERDVTGRFVLGCDGARSFVRTAVGISFTGNRIDEPHLVVDFAEFPDPSPYSRFFCSPARPFNSVPTPYGGRRLEFMLNPGEDHGAIATADSVRDLIDRHSPYKGAQLNIIRAVVYGFSERIAERMQAKRVFLLGDAAHVMPPFGAQAMNTGARDANNLGWKLAAVLRRQLDPRVLDTYEPERRPQIEAIVRYSVMIGRLANIRSRARAAVRDLAFRAVNLVPSVRRYFNEMRYMPRPWLEAGFLVRSGNRDRDLRVGRTVPRVSLALDDGTTPPIDAVLGNSFCLVGVGVPAATLKDIGLPGFGDARRLAIALDGAGAQDIAGVRSARPATQDARAQLAPLAGLVMLVRPDRYVAAIAPPSEMPSALAQLVRAFGFGREA